MGATADELREEIAEKRDDAASRIDEIEQRVGAVSDQARSTVEDTTERIKEAFDVRQQVEKKPLMAVGVGIAAGFLLGGLSGGSGGSHRGGMSRRSAMSASGLMASIQDTAKQVGLEDTLSAAGAALMGSVSNRVRDTVEETRQNATGGGSSKSSSSDQPPTTRVTTVAPRTPASTTTSTTSNADQFEDRVIGG